MTRRRSSTQMAVRTCAGCGGRAPQSALLRFGIGEDGTLVLRSHAPARGRSAYLHPDPECWDKFAARKGTVISLRRPISREERRRFTATLAQRDRIRSELC